MHEIVIDEHVTITNLTNEDSIIIIRTIGMIAATMAIIWHLKTTPNRYEFAGIPVD